jgi:hypothetical protein
MSPSATLPDHDSAHVVATLGRLHAGTRQLRESRTAGVLLGEGPLLLVRNGQVLTEVLRRGLVLDDALADVHGTAAV